MQNQMNDLTFNMQFEPELNDREKALRLRFVEEYFYDRDPIAAACRIGFMAAFAKDFAQQFMSEGFVLRAIKEREQGLLSQEPQALEEKKRKVEESYWQIVNDVKSSSTAKVSALNSLAMLYNMNIKQSVETDESEIGGVMVVPAMTTPDEWGASAYEQQAKLKETVKD